jgi:hypothetical protein
MSIPNFRDRPPEEIIGCEYLDDSAWHIYTALSWLDYAQRKNAPIALHYSGFHLRYGIELLWFEIFFAAKGGEVSPEEYAKAVKKATTLYKLIDSQAPHYKKFAEFIEIIGKIDPHPPPPMTIWDVDKLKRIHGECGSLLLHFQGVQSSGYLQEAWLADRIAFLDVAAQWIWSEMTSTGRIVLYRPDDLSKPTVFNIWEDFRDGNIDGDSVRVRLKITEK